MLDDPVTDPDERIHAAVRAEVRQMFVRLQQKPSSPTADDEATLVSIGQVLRSTNVSIARLMTPRPGPCPEVDARARVEALMHQPVIGRLATCAMAIDFRLALPHSQDAAAETLALVRGQLELVRDFIDTPTTA